MESLPKEVINNIVSFTKPVNLTYFSYTWYESRNKEGCYNFALYNPPVNLNSSIEFKKIVERFRPIRNTHYLKYTRLQKVINHNYNFLYHLQK